MYLYFFEYIINFYLYVVKESGQFSFRELRCINVRFFSFKNSCFRLFRDCYLMSALFCRICSFLP